MADLSAFFSFFFKDMDFYLLKQQKFKHGFWKHREILFIALHRTFRTCLYDFLFRPSFCWTLSKNSRNPKIAEINVVWKRGHREAQKSKRLELGWEKFAQTCSKHFCANYIVLFACPRLRCNGFFFEKK